MINEITDVTNKQAGYGQAIAQEINNVNKQTEELKVSSETQTKEVEEVVDAINDVTKQIHRLQ